MGNKKIKIEVEIPEGYDLVINGTDCKLVPKSRLPKTWEEFCEMTPIKDGESVIHANSEIASLMDSYDCRQRDVNLDKSLLPDKETAEAVLALCQLIQLRNCYNGDWEPDWTRPTEKYVLRSCCRDSDENVVIIADREYYSPRVLTFKSEELRDQFFENFSDLIEIAKPLI